MDQLEQPNPATASADAILAYANARGEESGHHLRESAIAGVLTAYVRFLCDDRDRLIREANKLRGVGLTAQRGCELTTITIGDATVPAQYTYEPGDPGCWRTPNGDGWPEIPPEVTLESLYINGTWTDARDVLGEDRCEEFEARLLEKVRDEQDAMREEAAWERQEEKLAERGYP